MLPRLTMMRTFGWLVAAIPAISALAPAAARADEPDKSFALTNASDSGLVVLGFEGARTWTIYLIGYDPKTNRALRNQGGEFEGFWPLFPEVNCGTGSLRRGPGTTPSQRFMRTATTDASGQRRWRSR